jgi:hypothetical protein
VHGHVLSVQSGQIVSGVPSSTLRYWLWWWSSPDRSPKGVEEKGRDPEEQAALVRAELEAREAAGPLRKPADAESKR